LSSRIAAAFDALRARGRGGLVAYVTAGDPDAGRSEEVLLALARGGADVIEVGVPFSDPLADGPVIQRASERALAAGMTLRRAIDLVARVRPRIEVPLVLFTYANPVSRMGHAAFAGAAAAAGVDGVLILDYPIEEAAPLSGLLAGAGLDPIVLVSPTTSDERMAKAAEAGRGFLYVISRLGVTGARDAPGAGVDALLARVRARTDLPIALGFGISNPEQVAAACRAADAAVVGSAIVQVVADRGADADLPARVEEFVRWLKSAL
jgi:tryptophan synthase alpha chain